MAESRSFLLLHGFANHRPPEHWMHWLAGELDALGERVLYPQLPDPDSPTVEQWLRALDQNLEELMSAGDSAERIVICHSLSCMLWFRAATILPAEPRPDRVVLVSPPGVPWIPEPASEFGLATLDAPAVRSSAVREVRIVCSDADPYNPPGTPAVYGEPLGLECDLVPGGGHISTDDGYGPWPAMLAWCQAPGGPVGGEHAAAR